MARRKQQGLHPFGLPLLAGTIPEATPELQQIAKAALTRGGFNALHGHVLGLAKAMADDDVPGTYAHHVEAATEDLGHILTGEDQDAGQEKSGAPGVHAGPQPAGDEKLEPDPVQSDDPEHSDRTGDEDGVTEPADSGAMGSQLAELAEELSDESPPPEPPNLESVPPPEELDEEPVIPGPEDPATESSHDSSASHHAMSAEEPGEFQVSASSPSEDPTPDASSVPPWVKAQSVRMARKGLRDGTREHLEQLLAWLLHLATELGWTRKQLRELVDEVFDDNL